MKLDTEIVGVVANSLVEGPREGIHRQVFIPNWNNGGVAFYVRTSLSPPQMYAALRSEVKKLDASMPVYALKTLGAQLDETLLVERLIALLSAGFGLLATLLACIGLYGVMAFAVARRTKEMGVRMALGAPQNLVMWMVLREVLVLVSVGLIVGVPAAIAAGTYISSQLYEIKGSDPGIALVTILVLLLVSVMAGLIPAHRASRIDPVLALRYE